MAAPDREPYVGPRAFQRDEKELFFGRDREKLDLASLVIAHPIVLLYAASGAGKSSLLNAGLIPLLEEQHHYEVLRPARVSGHLPPAISDADVDNIYVFNILSSWADPSAAPAELLHADLAGFLAHRPHRNDEGGEPLLRVVILDQFEELFTFAPERWRQREGLIRQLAAALDADPLLRIVLAMREEFIGPFGTYASLLPHGTRTRFHLEPLGPEAAKEAIEGPLKGTERKIEPQASDRLVQELLKIHVRGAGGETVEALGPFVEPVQLQVVCTKLWDTLPAEIQVITADHVQTFGDVNEALKEFYEDALSAAAQKTAVSGDRLRSWVDHDLITPGGTRGMVYRGAETTGSEETAIPNTAVDVLEEKHLIRAEARAGERWYELTHDRFIAPIKESLRVWKELYERRQRRWKIERNSIVALICALFLIVTGLSIVWQLRRSEEYDATDGQIEQLLALNSKNHAAAEQEAPAVLDSVAAYLWHRYELGQRNELDHLTELLQRADSLIPENYRAQPQIAQGTAPAGDQSSPLELDYNPTLSLTAAQLFYQWREMAARLADDWGIPVPATLKLKADDTVPVDYLRVVVGEAKSPLVYVGATPGFVLISENGMEPELQTWFDGHKSQWPRDASLTIGGPWWLVPHWTRPLFEAAGHPAVPREAGVAAALATAVLTHPELALNRDNVALLLQQLSDDFPRTVAEARAARGDVDGLVNDLRAIVAEGYPLGSLQYVLDSLAGYSKSDYPAPAAAKLVIEDQKRATPRPGLRLTGVRHAVPVESNSVESHLALLQLAPYRDMAVRTQAGRPIRVYLGSSLIPQLATPDGELRPVLLEAMSDLRGDLFKRFGIPVPGVLFNIGASTLAPDAFRIEVMNQTGDAPIEVRGNLTEQVVVNELRPRLLAFRTWWITADSVDEELDQSNEIKTWLLARYTRTDLKILLRGVVQPDPAGLAAYDAEGVDGVLQHTAPGQSIRDVGWLLASLTFWSQAYDPLDADHLVQALRYTQAARLAPSQASSTAAPMAAVGAGIEALERQDFAGAEAQFHQALATDRAGAIAAFTQAYASREAISVKGTLSQLTKACLPFAGPGQLTDLQPVSIELRFEIEDFLARNKDAIADADRARLDYCLLQYYAANNFPTHIRASLDELAAPQLSGQLEPNQKYALGYWTLELNGRSLNPPPDQAAAETWLTSAFREWKETTDDEDNAAAAVDELLNRYGGQLPPRWYMDMLQRLGELRSKNFWVAYYLGRRLSDGRDIADADQALVWLSRARERLAGLTAEDKPRMTAWTDYRAARTYFTKAKASEETTSEQEAQETIKAFESVIQSIKNSGAIKNEKWPGADAYNSLIQVYQFLNQFDEAAKVLDAARQDGLGNDSALLSDRFFLVLVAGHKDEALQVAQQALATLGESDPVALYLASLSQLLTNQPDAEVAARQFLATDHEYRDYIRLMLYWYLARQGKFEQAKAYLDERWRSIDPTSWPARLLQGDVRVWLEQLIGYFLGQVKRDAIFAPLGSREAFQSSGLGRTAQILGLTYNEMRCEAYFYDALLQDVTGDSTTRSARFTQSLQSATKIGRGTMDEYMMAQYLLSLASAHSS